MLKRCFMHSHTGPVPGIMVWSGIGYHFLLCSMHCRYFKQPVLHFRGVGGGCPSLSFRAWPQPYFNRIMLDDMARFVQRFFVKYKIELLP
ncbi:hypothetical protein TNCV_4203651 [Trichonephila clavipes]|nr:hypothetical protein TNCV_4203651 [Trichonephila clavipes]